MRGTGQKPKPNTNTYLAKEIIQLQCFQMTSMFSNLSKLLDQLAVDCLATQPHACLLEFGTQLQKQGQPHAKQQPINRNPHDQVVERNVSKSSSVTCPKP
jgi:hypothetical protein